MGQCSTSLRAWSVPHIVSPNAHKTQKKGPLPLLAGRTKQRTSNLWRVSKRCVVVVFMQTV